MLYPHEYNPLAQCQMGYAFVVAFYTDFLEPGFPFGLLKFFAGAIYPHVSRFTADRILFLLYSPSPEHPRNQTTMQKRYRSAK